MGHLFQYECWEKHPSGCSFQLIWLRKLEKEIEKDLERKSVISWHLFMKIIENKRKWR